MRRGLVLICLLAPALLAPPAGAAADPERPAFRITDPRITEASGIAAGIRSPGVVYVHNDSGDRARFFALDARSGRVLAEYDVPGVAAVDWEDIAVAPDADGTPSVWLADIGDNMRDRSKIELYRVDEPKVSRSRPGVTTSTARPDVWRLRYPTGPDDAESLAVSPRGVPYLVTKSLAGDSLVYRAPPGGGTLQRVGSVQFHFTGTPGPYPPIGQLTATGAALSPDGARLVVRTYTDAYVWTVHDGDVAAALHSEPRRIALPVQPQGEGVCFIGQNLMIDSEGRDSPVYLIGLPQPKPATSSAPPSVATQPPSTPAADAEPTPHNDTLRYLLAATAAAVIAAVGLAEAMRRRRA